MIFNVTLDRDEDGVWIVECPSIPGRVSSGRDQRGGAGERERRHQAMSASSGGEGLTP